MKEKDIHTLVARFLDGETTLEEERKLYAFFQREDVPADLKEYQEMFRGFAALAPQQADEKRTARKMPLWGRVASMAAACFLVVSLIGYTLYQYETSSPQKKGLIVQKPTTQPQKEQKMIAEAKKEMKQEEKKEVKQDVKKDVKKEVNQEAKQVVAKIEVVNKDVKPEEAMPIAPSSSIAREANQEANSSTATPAFSSGTAITHVAEPKAIYASNEASDSTYQEPSRMDDFITEFANYNQVAPVALECSLKGDSTMMSVAYVFPDKKELDVFGRLLQAACWYDDATPGYHLNFSHLQFFFELKDERKGLKYLWIADRINGKILLYSTHSPIGTTVSSECYQKLRDGLMHANNKVTYQL